MTLIDEGHQASGVTILAEAVVLVVQPAPLILFSYVAVVDEALHFAVACLLASDELTIEFCLPYQVFQLALAMLLAVLEFTFVDE